MRRLRTIVTHVLLLVPLQLAVLETRAATVAGRVATRSDEPIVRAKVALSTTSLDGPRRTTREAETDGEGRFRFEDTEPGDYRLVVTKSGWRDDARAVNVSEQQVDREIELTVVLDPTWQRRVAVLIRLGVLVYVMIFGLLVFITNYWIAPVPSPGLSAIGWATIATSVVIAIIKGEWLQGVLLLVVGAPLAAVICRYGRQSAARRQAEMEDEKRIEQAAQEREREQLTRWLGRKGTAVTDLKPFGSVQIDDELIEARARRGFLPSGTPVVVAKLDGKTLVVDDDR